MATTPKLFVTGATGQLGRLVIDTLLQTVPASAIVAGMRDPAKDEAAAGVGLIAYTSILHADTSPLFLAEEHRDTEAALAEAGIPFVPLRNGCEERGVVR